MEAVSGAGFDSIARLYSIGRAVRAAAAREVADGGHGRPMRTTSVRGDTQNRNTRASRADAAPMRETRAGPAEEYRHGAHRRGRASMLVAGSKRSGTDVSGQADPLRHRACARSAAAAGRPEA